MYKQRCHEDFGRLKKILLWAIKNEWMEKNPFSTFKLRYKPSSMEYLREEELARIEQKMFGTTMLEKVRDFFAFSCYTGLAYIDLVALRPHNILTTADK